jgi:hypothetical protein
MPTCPAPRCLGHADERTAEVICSRCAGRRWVLVRPRSAPDPSPYLCRRCRAVLDGARHVLDPLVTAEQRARFAQSLGRHDESIGRAGTAPEPDAPPDAPRHE